MHSKAVPIQAKLWSKYFILIIFANLFLSICKEMLMTSLAVYSNYIGGDPSHTGMIAGVFGISALIFRPFAGKLTDSKGRQIMFIFGVFIFMSVSFAYSYAKTITILLCLRALHGIGFSIYSSVSGTIVSDIVPKKQLAEGIGLYGIAVALATAFGPWIGLYTLNNYSFTFVFIIAGLLSGASLVISLFINYEKKQLYQTEEQKIDVSNTDAKEEVDSNIPMLRAAFVLLFIAATMGSIAPFLATYAMKLNIENIGLYFIAYAASLIFVRLFAGKIADNHGFDIVIIPGICLIILSFFILIFAKSITILIISGIFFGLGYGMSQPAFHAKIVKLCPVHKRGTGNAIFFAAMDIGFSGGAVLWGIIAKSFGFVTMYICCAGFGVIALFSYFLTLKLEVYKK